MTNENKVKKGSKKKRCCLVPGLLVGLNIENNLCTETCVQEACVHGMFAGTQSARQAFRIEPPRLVGVSFFCFSLVTLASKGHSLLRGASECCAVSVSPLLSVVWSVLGHDQIQTFCLALGLGTCRRHGNSRHS